MHFRRTACCRAYCLAKMGRYDEAVAEYDAVIALDPSDAHAYHNRCAGAALHVRQCLRSRLAAALGAAGCAGLNECAASLIMLYDMHAAGASRTTRRGALRKRLPTSPACCSWRQTTPWHTIAAALHLRVSASTTRRCKTLGALSRTTTSKAAPSAACLPQRAAAARSRPSSSGRGRRADWLAAVTHVRWHSITEPCQAACKKIQEQLGGHRHAFTKRY